LRNKGDNLVYTTEKSLKDFGSKVSDSDRKNIEEKMAHLKEILKKQDVQSEELQKAIDELTQASYKLAEEVYKSSAKGAQGAQGAQPSSGAADTHGKGANQESGSAKDGEAIDADYKEEKK